MKKLCVALLPAIILMTAGISMANTTYSLDVFTNNGIYAHSPNINLYFQPASDSSGIDFVFHNASTIDSSIAQIYFDDVGLLAYKGLTDGTDVKFSPNASPGNLPAANMLTPSFQADFSFGANPPPSKNGINPGQSLTISFNFVGTTSYNDVINALNNDRLRIGAHLIALPDGSSESVAAIPEPATFSLFAIGGLFLAKRKKYRMTANF